MQFLDPMPPRLTGPPFRSRVFIFHNQKMHSTKFKARSVLGNLITTAYLNNTFLNDLSPAFFSFILILHRYFYTIKITSFGGIQTCISGIESELADHFATMALARVVITLKSSNKISQGFHFDLAEKDAQFE